MNDEDPKSLHVFSIFGLANKPWFKSWFEGPGRLKSSRRLVAKSCASIMSKRLRAVEI